MAVDRLASTDRAAHSQVNEKLVERPPRYWARASREPAMLGIKNGRRPQLDNTHVIVAEIGYRVRGDETAKCGKNRREYAISRRSKRRG